MTSSLGVPPSAVAQPLAAMSFAQRYTTFAKDHPFWNSVLIAGGKSAAADLVAQSVQGTNLLSVDWRRTALFLSFGALYSGAFQYLYQVNLFGRAFPEMEAFCQQAWAEKLRDGPGLRALAGQTGVDLAVFTLCYLPSFYMLKAAIFSGSAEPLVWAESGLAAYREGLGKDGIDGLRCWLPADLICFSVPLYQRLPCRHFISFFWTMYLSFLRGSPSR